jgi:hypothetical protein
MFTQGLRQLLNGQCRIPGLEAPSFVGGGPILLAIWLLMLARFAQISWRMARRREANR